MTGRRLTSLLLTCLAAAALLATAGCATDAQNRARAFSLAALTSAGGSASESPWTRPGSQLSAPEIAAGCCVAAKEATGAASSMSGRLLKRQLASEAQFAGRGRPIMGAGTDRELRAGPRLAREYGGDPADYAKMTSPGRYSDGDGVYDLFETHWYENVRTGARYEPKTKFPLAEDWFRGPNG